MKPQASVARMCEECGLLVGPTARYCSTEDCPMACDHEWEFSGQSYEGDPNVYRGTLDYRVFTCTKCGDEENRSK